MTSGTSGRPLRALAGLAAGLALWLALRAPALRHEVQAMARLAQPEQAAVRARSDSPDMPGARRAAPAVSAMMMPPATLRPAMPRAARRVSVAAPFLPPGPAPPPAVPPTVPPVVPPVVPPAAPSAAPLPPDPAFALAGQAYDRQRAGQRRQAAALFDAALALQPGNRQWQADRAALGRRWQLGGFALLRDGGAAGPAASPVLGGGQLGGSIAFLPDPFARRPLALVARGNVAADAGGVRGETGQLALGLRQTLLPGVSVAVERLIPLGNATRGAFTARLAAGGAWQRLEGYGEAGVLDTGQVYAGGQSRARLVRLGPATLHAAAWASVQTGSPDVWRVDVGPSLSARIRGIRIEADWRQRIGGNAAPGSGPVVTLSAGF
jgi:hypothetical protein